MMFCMKPFFEGFKAEIIRFKRKIFNVLLLSLISFYLTPCITPFNVLLLSLVSFYLTPFLRPSPFFLIFPLLKIPSIFFSFFSLPVFHSFSLINSCSSSSSSSFSVISGLVRCENFFFFFTSTNSNASGRMCEGVCVYVEKVPEVIRKEVEIEKEKKWMDGGGVLERRPQESWK
uniref:Transmembrane protein n=1 Tax=Cacopsylla melanoneura TaxID=428564 RepID=A0A8D9AQ27_9HEMI